MTVTILVGDALAELRKLPSESVHCCVTSPPYWGLRDYGVPPRGWGGDEACEHRWGDELLDRSRRSPGTQGSTLTGDGRYQATDSRFETRSHFCIDCGAWRGVLGLEPTPEFYIDHLVQIFEEVRRVLRNDGTLWLNLGDSYATGAGKVGDHPGGGEQGNAWAGRPNVGSTSTAGHRGKKIRADRDGTHAGKHTAMTALGPRTQPNRMPIPGLKPKDLVGIPWMAAFALRRAGWWLRQDIIWSKPNPMPESITDRCTKAHEYLFLLSKSERYYFEAIKEPASYDPDKTKFPDGWDTGEGGHGSFHRHGREKGRASGNKTHKAVAEYEHSESEEHRTKAGLLKISNTAYPTRNKRSVWTVATAPFKEAHFATFPTELIEPCIKAGCPEGGTVLDPFGGAGTTGLAADRWQRNAILIELNPAYAEIARRRIDADAPLFARAAE